MKTARGRRELEAHQAGRRLTYYRAILAKCFECTGGYADGKADCFIPACPLHSFMPYREGKNGAR